MNSTFGKINMHDLIKGFLVAFIASVFFGINQVMQTGLLPTLPQLGSIAIVGVSAGLAYISKNLLTNGNGEVFKKDKP